MNTARDDKAGNRIAYALARTVFLFGLIAWVYVVTVQLRDFNTVYDVFAMWLPTRLDYFEGAAFALNIVAHSPLKFWETMN